MAVIPLRLPTGCEAETAAVVIPLRPPNGYGEGKAAEVIPLRLSIEGACLPIEC